MKILQLLALLSALSLGNAHAEVVVIVHDGLDKLDAETIQKIYTGKIIEVKGIKITAVNLKPGQLRERFIQKYLDESDAQYTAYWTVRRYIGKGTPPLELSTSEEVKRFVQSTPGAIGYVDESEVTPDLHVITWTSSHNIAGNRH